MIRCALALTFLAAPALAQDDIPDMTDAAEVPNLDCEQTGEDASCTFDALASYDFCMAIGEDGEPSPTPRGPPVRASSCSRGSRPTGSPRCAAVTSDRYRGGIE